MALLACLPNGRFLHRFPSIYKATREHPFAVGRFNGPPDQQDAALHRNDRPDRHLGIEEENEAAGTAHQPIRLGHFDGSASQRPSALRTERVVRTLPLLVCFDEGVRFHSVAPSTVRLPDLSIADSLTETPDRRVGLFSITSGRMPDRFI